MDSTHYQSYRDGGSVSVYEDGARIIVSTTDHLIELSPDDAIQFGREVFARAMGLQLKGAHRDPANRYIYFTKQGIVVQVPGLSGKRRTRRVRSLEEAIRVRGALLAGLKVVPVKGRKRR